MKRIIGYKFLRADGSSINGEHMRITYTRHWQEISGNGAYVGFTWEGLCAGGEGAIIAEVECQRPTGAWAPDGATCYGRVRVLRWLAPPTASARAEYGRATAPALAKYERVRASARAEYQRVTAPALAEYQRATASAWAEYERVRASAWLEYERATASARAEYERVRAPAWAEYERATAPAWAEYGRVRASAWAEYERVTARAFRRMMRRCNPAKPQGQPQGGRDRWQ